MTLDNNNENDSAAKSEQKVAKRVVKRQDEDSPVQVVVKVKPATEEVATKPAPKKRGRPPRRHLLRR